MSITLDNQNPLYKSHQKCWIYEVLKVSPSIKELILKNKSSDEIKKQAIKEGMKTLRMSALIKAVKGLSLQKLLSPPHWKAIYKL